MPTSLLKRLLNRAAGAKPGDPQTICGSIAPGERVDIGPLRAVNDGGDLVVRQLNNNGTLNWVYSPDSELCISNLGNRPDEGVMFSLFGGAAWAFIAKVRPERCVVLRPVPVDVPLCRFGPGGDYNRDCPEEEEDFNAVADAPKPLRRRREHAENAVISFSKIPDDQATRLRRAMAQPARANIEVRDPATGRAR